MRGAPAIARRAGGPLRDRGYGPLALWRWLRLTGGAPALSGKDFAGHIAFIRESEPERYARDLQVPQRPRLPQPAPVRPLRRRRAIRSSPTWVTDNRGGACRYDARLIAQLGVERDKLPEIVGSTDTLGPLSARRRTRSALRATSSSSPGRSTIPRSRSAPARCATSRPTSISAPRPGSARICRSRRPNLASKIAAVPCAIEGRYLATALQSAAGSNLSFFRDRILYHPDELLSDEQRPDVYQALDRIAASVPAGARGLVYTPWLFGERSPVDDANLRAGLLNLSLEHSRADIVRAFLEGVALNTRWMLEPFERFVGRANAPLTAVGGGAQSDLWCQILADATGRAIRQPETPIQANAMGAAFIAAVGLGALTFADVPALMRWRRDYAPRRAVARALRRALRLLQGRLPSPRSALSPAQPVARGRRHDRRARTRNRRASLPRSRGRGLLRRDRRQPRAARRRRAFRRHALGDRLSRDDAPPTSAFSGSPI